MKRSFLFCAVGFVLILSFSSCAVSEKSFSVLGDSYSTFRGYVTPDTNALWYGLEENYVANDVRSVEETWWWQLDADPRFKLEMNNAFSGATVSYTGYSGENYKPRSFITRMTVIPASDIILLFGGTNDSWAGSPIGEFQYGDWERADFFSFRPAFAYMLEYFTTNYSKSRIVNITNSELSDEISSSIEEICRHYGVENVLLHDIDKGWGHPSVAGMRAIYEQLAAVLSK